MDKQAENFLSNMAKNVTEIKNAAHDHPEIVSRLTKLHKERAQEVKQM